MQTVWIARHANRQDFADPNWADTADRPHDPGLSTDGVEQAQQLARRVNDLDVDRIVASPFLRTVETAHYAAEAADEPVFIEPGLGEWRNDDWFNAPPSTLSFPALARRFDRLSPHHTPCRTPDYPESKHEALGRLGATGQCLTDTFPEDTLLLVGHGITVQGILHGLVRSDLPNPGCPLASLTQVVRQEDGWTLRIRNDTRHLENGARASRRLA